MALTHGPAIRRHAPRTEGAETSQKEEVPRERVHQATVPGQP
jgi:hypothetical protein